MSLPELDSPFWWRIFERADARFSADEVAKVSVVQVIETENGSTSPDLSVTALFTLRNGHGASIRAHYSHSHRRITSVMWSVTTHPLPLAQAA